MQTFKPVTVAQLFMRPKLTTAEVIVDATCGNGHDCLFLAKHSQPEAQIYAFDIQTQSILNSKKLLAQNCLDNKVEFYQENFVNIKKYVDKKLDLVVFNLGYLPGENKNITTCVNDLCLTIPLIVELLSVQGIIIIVSYPGHEQGKKEFIWLEKYLPELSNKVYNVGKYQLFNHQKPSPIVYIMEIV